MVRRNILAVWFIWKAAFSSVLFVRHRVSTAFQTELPIGIGSYIGEKEEPKSRLCAVPPKNPKSIYGGKSRREDEIGRKILQLKKEGKINKQKTKNIDPVSPQQEQEESIRSSDFGGNSSSKNEKAVGRSSTNATGSASIPTEYTLLERLRQSREKQGKSSKITQQYQNQLLLKRRAERASTTAVTEEDDDEEEIDMLDEEDEGLSLERVAQKWQDRMGAATKFQDVNFVRDIEEKEREMDQLYGYKGETSNVTASSTTSSSSTASSSTSFPQTTTGVGGNWKGGELGEIYKPSRGSWGAFPRPKDISKAYGGGRRVDPDLSEEKLKQSEDITREKLRAYREKVGIVVESEIKHADEIEEALTLSSRAMLRGVYATAVSALEKVTPYCSTNSKTGGKVFLELAMAYEAAGRTDEAIAVYTQLAHSRIEDIKFNAKRLLYGIEAMQFMRNDIRASSFSRKKITQDFIDLTGFNNMSEKFDDTYATAYVDVDKASYYKRLSSCLVRSFREARFVLLTTTAGVDRLRIVQALRFLNRDFESALRNEKAEGNRNIEERAFVPLMNGAPIMIRQQDRQDSTDDDAFSPDAMDTYYLLPPDQMLKNINGEWKLLLIADKSGDGVKFFNSTTAWQKIDTLNMEYAYDIPAAPWMTCKRTGLLTFESQSRTLERKAPLSYFFPLPSAAAPTVQIISVDSELCITRLAGEKLLETSSVKDYFAVWRRVEPGTYAPLVSTKQAA